jgi:hypothetical protein
MWENLGMERGREMVFEIVDMGKEDLGIWGGLNT